ncbi:hypothetical protein GCM10008956_16320 [Deinococcus arenae]|uniref:Uncharacterized protein n=1 Tax=Deinococcus arenae TaxID=1452751 RepID=A0A8H9GPS7_9DEIO|nr:hypothetical protein GCM10008956_16320 [Deinococcus arenae]
MILTQCAVADLAGAEAEEADAQAGGAEVPLFHEGHSAPPILIRDEIESLISCSLSIFPSPTRGEGGSREATER